ncbi:MAG: Asp-tRNA(Asn)/Glu-tRNA(Gln) amidotransferase subunit GatB [Armatimonadetes bacterium]|nr:MAG: Asp-tRNA(Asn)/Glu-tRNA(Gln) amidotransferase subunit GatB [Armatimonadota bacterium]MCE7900582.1 Asp-tRNA(Asn)/Glu-tRNA(Gln) amidotransferase subunit GatB [Armatimonadetes bacterium ATM1]MDL1929355.1 Asp-tRNA(Asn)/Glu-tRNA(Gln) amidotransferase subunit GatB [Fimbriimonadia bacterium ATM]MBC6970179.1 Asp-tRNA(Asn)/Glu-tRNA(Gln) amidotransferase subunit GatB [Armatimonadota bacterium]MBL1149931.1 Asp-tRNA(Asn)/Glu-tRNA(Gln) amidotransferase subunit GatB [Armatimonadota bacterium]
MVSTEFELSVGLEVHAELLTLSKMFCGCPNEFGGEPNTRVCPVCLGLPGSLPVINRQAVEHVLKTALALNCSIAMRSMFHRKNYFYPDLPKGYQISQYEETNPIGYRGWIEIPLADGATKTVRIRRVHLEEDTGKLMHLPGGGSGVDFNRAGVPLMEIVTDFPPDVKSAEEARSYLQELRLILLYLGVCDGRMEQGSFRCEPNISIAPPGAETLGTKVELKNLGSFKAVALGIEYERSRMESALARGETLHQETRGWDESAEISYPMRRKEGESDYRYFTDPDLPPLAFDEETIERVRASLPELPGEKRRRYRESLGLGEYDANLLVADPEWAAYFDEAVSAGGDAKLVCNWMNSDFARLLNESGQRPRTSKVTPERLAELVGLIQADQITGKIAKEVFDTMFATGDAPGKIVSEKGLSQIADAGELAAIVADVLSANPDAVEKYKSGKAGVLGFLVGQVMQKTRGRANPQVVNNLLVEKLTE